MTHAEEALRVELEERLRFEALLVDLSARFVHVPADQVDRMIEEAQRRIVQGLGLDRSTLLQRSNEEDDLVITHACAVPSFAPNPRLFAKQDFPWVHQTLLRGGIVRFSKLEELPAEAGRDKESFRTIQQKSNLILPLASTGRVFGALKPLLSTATAGTAQEGAPETNGSTSSPACAAPITTGSTLDQSRAPPGAGWTAPHWLGTRMLPTPPRLIRCSWSSVGVSWGTIPQNLAGRACAVEARAPASTTAIAKAAVQARTAILVCFRSLGIA